MTPRHSAFAVEADIYWQREPLPDGVTAARRRLRLLAPHRHGDHHAGGGDRHQDVPHAGTVGRHEYSRVRRRTASCVRPILFFTGILDYSKTIDFCIFFKLACR